VKTGHINEAVSVREGCVLQTEQRSIHGVYGDGRPHVACKACCQRAYRSLIGCLATLRGKNERERDVPDTC